MKRTFLVALALLALASPSFADDYPTRPVKIVVPFGPGGFTDVVARILQKELQPVLGQPIVIENRPGAGSTIGTDVVAKSPPDGYTLAMVSTTHVISPHLYKKMPYDALADFTPVMRLVEGPYVMVVNPSLGVKNVKEFIALASKEPGRIFFASSGNGSSQHLVGALFMQMAGVKLTHVPYKGSNAAMQDLLGGRVKASFVGMPNAIPNLANGRLIALGVTTKKRSPDLPDVPTLDEAGVKGYEATIWLGLVAPKGTPRDVVDKLNESIRKVLADPKAQQLMHKAGVEVAPSTPEQFGALMKTEYDRWGAVVQKTGAVVN
jgi:tripartite-type tricarboxylate transporter receptor subunit TctC